MLLLTLQVVWKELTENIKKVKQTIFLMSKSRLLEPWPCRRVLWAPSIRPSVCNSDFSGLAHYTLFYISNAIFQLSLSVDKLFNELSLKCYLSFAYYILTSSYWETFYFVYGIPSSRCYVSLCNNCHFL